MERSIEMKKDTESTGIQFPFNTPNLQSVKSEETVKELLVKHTVIHCSTPKDIVVSFDELKSDIMERFNVRAY